MKKDPEKRKTCAELLQHPWLQQKATGPQCLVDLVQKRKKLESAQDKGAESDEESEEEAESDDEEKSETSLLKSSDLKTSDEKAIPKKEEPAKPSTPTPQVKVWENFALLLFFIFLSMFFVLSFPF